MKGEAQTIALPRTGLTCDSETEVRLTAVTAIRQVAEKNDPGSNLAVAGQPLRRGPSASQTAALILVERAEEENKSQVLPSDLLLFTWRPGREQQLSPRSSL